METRTEYINRNRVEIEAEGIDFSDCMAEALEDEYYDEIVIKHIKAGGMISNEVYKDLTDGQQYHFNKFLNWDNDKIINSDYEQEVKRLKKISDEKHKIYLQEQEQKRQEQEIREQIKEQKAKDQIKQKLTQEIEILKNCLVDYDNLSMFGKGRITRFNYEQMQVEIKKKIAVMEQQIKSII